MHRSKVKKKDSPQKLNRRDTKELKIGMEEKRTTKVKTRRKIKSTAKSKQTCLLSTESSSKIIKKKLKKEETCLVI